MDTPTLLFAVLSSFALGLVALWGFMLCRSERAPGSGRPGPDPGVVPVPVREQRETANVVELDRVRRRRSA
ncbi:MAG TPA: hypothetical protein VM784_08330 [Actinomycetota bacterium]|nr:hypothetical protein [Actinomycetota bacterium]